MKLLEGWGLFGFAAGLNTLLCAALLGAGGVDEIRLIIRVTARISLVLFCLAFTAAALARLWPSRWTRWTRRNRRYLGLSFAWSHGLHALAIAGFAVAAPEQFAQQVPAATLIGGGLAYIFIAAMAATSFDRTAAAIGPRAWKILHTAGSYYIWIVFMNSYGGRAFGDAAYLPPALIVLAALAIRLAPLIRRRAAA